MSRERELLLARVRRAEDPTPEDEERVLSALLAALAAGHEASPSAQAAERAESLGELTTTPGVAALKVSAGVAVVAAAAVGAVLWHTTRDLGTTPKARPAPAGGEVAPREAGSEPVNGRTSGGDVATAREADSEARQAPAPARGDAASREAGVEVLNEALAPARGQAASRELEARRAPQRARSAGPEPAEARVAASLRTELALLERVQAALRRGDGTAALRELDAHHTSDRALLAEREAARILALCLVGQVLEARRAARRFEAQHPDSPQRGLIAGSCANSRRIEEP